VYLLRRLLTVPGTRRTAGDDRSRFPIERNRNQNTGDRHGRDDVLTCAYIPLQPRAKPRGTKFRNFGGRHWEFSRVSVSFASQLLRTDRRRYSGRTFWRGKLSENGRKISVRPINNTNEERATRVPHTTLVPELWYRCTLEGLSLSLSAVVVLLPAMFDGVARTRNVFSTKRFVANLYN